MVIDGLPFSAMTMSFSAPVYTRSSSPENLTGSLAAAVCFGEGTLLMKLFDSRPVTCVDAMSCFGSHVLEQTDFSGVEGKTYGCSKVRVEQSLEFKWFITVVCDLEACG